MTVKPAETFTHSAHLLYRILFTLACLCLLLSAHTSQASSDFENPGSGTLILNHEGGSASSAMQLDANITIEASGLLADVTLTQTFRNSHTEWAEGRYLFPLPPDATIRGMQIKVGERTIIGEVKPRADAKATYEKAKNAGQVASLIEQQRPNMFTANVASIAPLDKIEVTIDILLPLRVQDGELQLTFPTTLTPRYINEQTPEATDIVGPFTKITEQRGPRLNLQASIFPLTDYSEVGSSTHTLQRSEDHIAITDAPMDRDITLRWPFALGDSEQSFAYLSTYDGQRYAQILLTPPSKIEEASVPSRELILVVDKSGSMSGVSMRAAREALHFALDNLSDKDSFNIVAFDNETYTLFDTSRGVSDESIDRARRFVNKLNAGGGTEMSDALNFALTKTDLAREDDNNTELNHDPMESERLRQIVFMTDGSAGNEHSLLNTIKQNLGSSRLFTVGIGSAPNSWFLKEAAQAGRGVALAVRDESAVAEPLTQLLNDLSTPVLTDINIQAEAGHYELYPKPIPDLYASSPLMLVAKIDKDVNSFIITGQHENSRWRETVQLDATQETVAADTDSAPSVAMQWARSKIDSLLDEQRYAVDNEMHKGVITQLALAVGLQTKYTSFVAVEAQPVKPANEKLSLQQVANLIPAGNDMSIIAMPQGAAGTDTLFVLSSLIGALGVAVFGFSRRFS